MADIPCRTSQESWRPERWQRQAPCQPQKGRQPERPHTQSGQTVPPKDLPLGVSHRRTSKITAVDGTWVYQTAAIPVWMPLFNIKMTKNVLAAAAAKSLQSCPTLCNPRDGSPPGSLIPGILQARTLEWVAISFSNAWKWKWSRSVVSDSLRPHGLQPTRLLRPWDFLGKSAGVGCHCLLQ